MINNNGKPLSGITMFMCQVGDVIIDRTGQKWDIIKVETVDSLPQLTLQCQADKKRIIVARLVPGSVFGSKCEYVIANGDKSALLVEFMNPDTRSIEGDVILHSP